MLTGCVRNRGTSGCARFVIALSVLSQCFAAPSSHARERDKVVDFHIEERNIGDALIAFAEQADLQLLFPYEYANAAEVNSVIGQYTLNEALSLLLRDTNFLGGLEESGILVVSLRSADGPDREGEMANGDLKKGLLASVAAFLSSGANAQGIEFISEGEDRQAQAEEERDEVIVTGTNIRGVESLASPLIVITREDIDRQGFSTTAQLLRNLPQNLDSGENTSTTARATNNGAPNGTAGVNVRGLGVGATLTLVNGRRVAAGGQVRQFVDVSLIPLSAVERVEVLTDGASAIYGTDAIAGVVNFILRDDFDGAETRFRFGGVTEGLSQEYQASQTIGQSWNGGNILAAYEYYRRNNLDTRSKSFTADAPSPTDILPRTERHSVFLTGAQNISESIEIFGNGSFSTRDTDSQIGSLSETFGDQLIEAFDKAEQYSGVLGVSVDLGSDWQSEAAVTYSNSQAENTQIVNGVQDSFVESDFSTWIADIQADGPLFSLPGGEAKFAVGGQFRRETFFYDVINASPVSADLDRNIYALFGEAYLPIVGEGNRRQGVYALDVTAAGRFEDYSDFGSSLDPKFGLRYAPVEGLNFRGTYGTSFKAPNMLQLGGIFGGVAVPGFVLLPLPGETIAPDVLLGNGNNPDLVAEESRTWTVGVDYTPPQLDGLTITATYFNISFDGRIATPAVSGLRDILARQDLYSALTVLPSAPEFQGLIDQFFPTNTAFNPFGVTRDSVGAFFDGRLQNIASTNVDGVDFSLDYIATSGIGDFQFGLNGSYLFEFLQRNFPGGVAEDILNRQGNPVDLRLRGNVGWSHEGAAISVFVNYVDSYQSDETGVIEPVDSWTTIDLNLSYRFDREQYGNVLGDTRLFLNITNLLDEEPPFVSQFRGFSNNGQNYDGANANALGRIISVQLEKTF